MRVKVFIPEDIHLLYLSPYVEFSEEQNRFLFRNDLFGKTAITPQIKGNPKEVIKQLRNGIETQKAFSFFEQNFITDNPQLLIDGLLQNGVLE
jgi:hypothetical protein